ncbi:hypothetical protein DERF_011220 [Dermatophagoides farinae]|uniref:Uncharacterized protein n=1 Tax=Dermatophagoides farinae TaxID=6954 RepID=A0A922HSH7_DERFA|nr:hypothetical protein DERF_011220 [Dermatophagoides farinae]
MNKQNLVINESHIPILDHLITVKLLKRFKLSKILNNNNHLCEYIFQDFRICEIRFSTDPNVAYAITTFIQLTTQREIIEKSFTQYPVNKHIFTPLNCSSWGSSLMTIPRNHKGDV